MSARGKFLPNSKCGIGSKSRSKHLSTSLGAVVLCVKNKKGFGKCVAVKGESKKHTLKGGGKIWAVNEKAPSRVSAGKKLKGWSEKQNNRLKRAAGQCAAAKKKGSKVTYRCCMSKKMSNNGKGSTKACKGSSLSGVTRRRKPAKRRVARRRAR